MEHLAVINPKSFIVKSDMHSVINNFINYFQVNGTKYKIHISRYPRDAMVVVNNYVSKAKETVRVYSIGGDGILYDCLNGLMGLPNAQLAVVPYGTSNDFVRAFGEDNWHVFRDINKQATALTISTAVMVLGNRYALNFCCVGGEAAVVLKSYAISVDYPNLAKIIGKSLYKAGIVLAFFNKSITNQKYEVFIDGERSEGDYLGINLGNGPCYGGSMTPFPMASPADGHIEVMTLTSDVSLNLAVKLYNYTKGRYYNYPDTFQHIRAKEVVIKSDTPMHINVDGEAYFGSEIKAKIIPDAVEIVAPDGLSYVRRQKL